MAPRSPTRRRGSSDGGRGPSAARRLRQIGIPSTIGLYSIFRSTLFDLPYPLPHPNPDRLVRSAVAAGPGGAIAGAAARADDGREPHELLSTVPCFNSMQSPFSNFFSFEMCLCVSRALLSTKACPHLSHMFRARLPRGVREASDSCSLPDGSCEAKADPGRDATPENGLDTAL